MRATGLAAGNVYFIRVFSASSTAGVVSNFKIGVGTRPVNDACDSAIMIPVSASTSCTPTMVFSTAGGATSTGTCSSTSYNDAVFFRFIATSNVHRVNVSYIGRPATVVSAYRGLCSSPTTPAYYNYCNTPADEVVMVDLTPGDTVTVRAASTSTTAGVNSHFAICVSTPPAQPMNDDWMGAIALTPSVDEMCANPVSGTTEGATPNGELVANPTCNASDIDDDVWFKFTATRTYHSLLFQNTSAPIVAQLYYDNYQHPNYFGQYTQGNSCASINAAPGEKKIIAAPGLIVGRTYYIRVASLGQRVNFKLPVTFDMCVISAAANDVYTGAIALTPQPAGNITPVASTTYSTSGNTANNSCSNGVTGVWYKFIATATIYAVSVTAAPQGVVVQASSSNSQNSFSSIGCKSSSNGAALLPLTGLAIGSTYYVEVGLSTPSVTNHALFNIAVLEPPTNMNCSGALPIPVSSAPSCPTPLLGSTLAANTSLAPSPDCNNTGLDDDIWYTFTATDTVHRLRLRAMAETLAVQLYTGSCAGLVPVLGGCLTSLPSAPANTATVLSNLTSGQTYYIRIWTPVATAGLAGLFEVCIQAQIPQPANDSCAGAILIATTPVGATCPTGIAGMTDGARHHAGNHPRCGYLDTNVDDVWYKFVATHSDAVVRLRNMQATYGTTSTAYAALYSGSCGSLNLLRCFQNTFYSTAYTGSTLIGGLTIGDTFYVRVYSGATSNLSFNICVQDTIPLPPATCSYTSYPSNGDTGVSLTPTISFGNSANATVYDLYLGTSPTSTTLIASVSASSYTIPVPLEQNTSYYAYVIARNSAGTAAGNCIGLMRSFKTLLRPPNDTADKAVLLTVGAACNTSSSTQPYSLRYASQSTDEPYPGCRAGTGRATVWYKFKAPASGAVRVRAGYGYQTTRVSLFSAIDSSNYTTFTDIACASNASSLSASALYAADLTPGARYYIAVDAYNPASSIYSGDNFCVDVFELDSTMLSTSSACSTTDSSRADIRRTYRGWVSVVNATGLQANVRLTGTSDSTFVGKQYRSSSGRSATMASGLSRSYLNRNLTLRSDSGATGYQVQLFMTWQEYRALQISDPDFDSLTQMVVTRKTSAACLSAAGTAAATDSLLLPVDEGAARGVRHITVRTKNLGAFFLHRGTPALTGCFPPTSITVSNLSTTGGTVS